MQIQKPPLIFVNALASSVGGNKRYYTEFIKYAAKIKYFRFLFLKDKTDNFNEKNYPTIKTINIKIYKKTSSNLPGGKLRSIKRMIWEVVKIRKLIKQYNATYYFTRAHQIPLLPKKVKVICVISSILPLIKQKNYINFLEKIRMLIQKIFLIRAVRRSELCICISNYCKKILKEATHIPPKTKILVLRNGLNSNEKKIRVLNANPLKILTVGNFYKYKQYELLLKIFYELRKKCPANLTIIGNPYDENYYRKVKEKIISLRLTSSVKILQKLTPKKIKSQYLNHNLFISASLFENSPIALLDALQFGMPCLVSCIPAHQEILSNQRKNMLFSPLSYRDALKKAAFLFSKKNRINNQKHILKRQKNFSWDKTFNKLFLGIHKINLAKS